MLVLYIEIIDKMAKWSGSISLYLMATLIPMVHFHFKSTFSLTCRLYLYFNNNNRL